MSREKLEGGKLLLAEPFMRDPFFKRSVVLLCENTKANTFGFILNKKLDMKVNELMSSFPEIDADVYFGGPVQNDTLHYIHNLGELLEESMVVSQGVYWGGNYEKLKFLISSKLIQPHNIRFFVGYSGWSKGQLQEEIDEGSWVTADVDANYLFSVPPDQLWQKVLEDMGNTYSVIAQMPDASNMN